MLATDKQTNKQQQSFSRSVLISSVAFFFFPQIQVISLKLSDKLAISTKTKKFLKMFPTAVFISHVAHPNCNEELNIN